MQNGIAREGFVLSEVLEVQCKTYQCTKDNPDRNAGTVPELVSFRRMFHSRASLGVVAGVSHALHMEGKGEESFAPLPQPRSSEMGYRYL